MITEDITSATLYISENMLAEYPNEEDQRDIIADEFRYIHLFFYDALERVLDPWFYHTEWDSFYKLYANITSTQALNTVLKRRNITRCKQARMEIAQLLQQVLSIINTTNTNYCINNILLFIYFILSIILTFFVRLTPIPTTKKRNR